MTRLERIPLLLVSGGRGPFGAPERVLWELATRLNAARYAVSVWLPPDPALDELAQSLEERGTPVNRVAEPRSRWALGQWGALGSALRKLRPEIVHLHADAGGVHHGLPSLARLAGVPHLVASVHGPAGARSWKMLHRADVVTVVCESAADALVQEKGIPRARVRVVPNGADPADPVAEEPAARRLRERLGAGRFRPLWVCAARLEESKGHDVLLEALGRLSERGLDFVVGLAGEGTRRAMLERRASELGLGSRVQFLGQVDSLGPVLLAADVVVLPSREESMPLSMLEAMARGRPMVASRVGGVPDVLVNGEHGLLVDPGDPEALAGALAELHGQPELARRLGEQGADRVRAAFTWPHVVERFEAIYDEVLGLAGFAPEPDPRRAGSAGVRG
jgi:glycosyltransferase involved in cell wall biosynthesis